MLDALSRSESDPAHHHAPRAGRGVHGRRLRPPHGALRGRDGDAGPGRHEPRHRHRGRVPRPGADGRDHRPGRHRRVPQGGAPARRHRVGCCGPITKWNQRVERVDAIPEIVRKAFRVARLEKPGPDPHRAAGEPRLAAARERRFGGAAAADTRLLPGADRRGDRACRRAAGRLRRGRSSWPGTACCGRRASPELRALARGLHVPVAVTFMGKGAIDDRSHLSLMAVGLQARDHVLTGFDRADLIVSVGYDPVEYAPARWNPDGTQADHPHRHAAGRGRRGVPARRSS